MPAHGYISNRFYTTEEYFALEQKLGMKYEYIDGADKVPVSNPYVHNEIASNIHQTLRAFCIAKPFRSFQETVPVGLYEHNLVYPDVLLAFDNEVKNGPHFLKEPLMIAEVLASNTETHDWTEKWFFYKEISSLKYILFVSQRKAFVQLYTRERQHVYQYELFENINDVIHLPDLAFSISLSEIYNNIIFPNIIGAPMGVYAEDE